MVFAFGIFGKPAAFDAFALLVQFAYAPNERAAEGA